MEHGARNGSHTNHDREQQANGSNGEVLSADKGQGKAKGKGKEPSQNMTPASRAGPNMLHGMDPSLLPSEGVIIPVDIQDRLKELPEEMVHITQNFIPSATLLNRFAQKTHCNLSATIMELAQMPVPSAVNGNSSHTSTDDNSAENVNKKLKLLEFAQNAHTDWTKAFVITSWSRNSEEVSKLIDLNNHLNQQANLYHAAIHGLAGVRRELGAARIPNPDLRTAVQVLSSGKAPWMPEVRLFL